MAVSLEGRVPYLDTDVLAWPAAADPDEDPRGQGKWVLREILKRHLPAELVDRPKHGFSVPIASWLRGPLRDWAFDLLDPGRIRAEGLLDPQLVASYWTSTSRAAGTTSTCSGAC